MANASRDENNVPTLLGISSADGKTPIPVYVDPDTHRLLVDLGNGVVGPGASTDKAIVRWEGTTGETIQNSSATIDDSGNITAPSFKPGGTAPVVDGTYTVGLGTPVTGHNGTITVKAGIIISVQQAD